MSTILDHIHPVTGGDFTPSTYREYFALQLARTVSSESDLSRYISLFQRYPSLLLAAAARRLSRKSSADRSFESYNHELQRGAFQGPGSIPPVVGVCINRRTIGYVVISAGTVLEEEKRELLNSQPAAIRTTTAFFAERCHRWQNSPIAFLAVEDPDVRRAELAGIAHGVMRDAALSVWQVRRNDVLAAFRQPAATTFQQVRRIISRVLPELAESRLATGVLVDAAIPALYVDVARQLLPEVGES